MTRKSDGENQAKGLIQKPGFPFTFNPEACTWCPGKCCNGESGTISISRKEIEALARYLGVEISRCIEDYLIKLPSRYSIREIKKGKNYACFFFDSTKNRCAIYPVRPHQCRTFPFWSYFKYRPDIAARECPGVSIIEHKWGDQRHTGGSNN